MKPKAKYFTISDKAKALLNDMEVRRYSSGYVSHMTPPTLRVSPKVYAEAKKALTVLGGDWKPHPGEFFFPDKCLFFHDLVETLETGCVYNKRQSFQFFPTPPDLARLIAMLVEAVVSSNMVRNPRLLEPSAGTGCLIDALTAVGFNAHSIDAVELQEEGADAIKAKYPFMQVKCCDFGDYGNERYTAAYDAVVMNPPFDGDLWQEHVEHACSMLSKTGFLVSVVPRAASLEFLPAAQRTQATLTPVKIKFDNTAARVSILTIRVKPSAVKAVFGPITDKKAQIAQDAEPIRSPVYYVNLIEKDLKKMATAMATAMAELKNML